MTVTIHVGDCRDVLATLPDESVQCVVTSPPYWGLRDYGIEPQVWGDADCEHEWGEFERPGMSGGTASKKVQIKGADNFQIVEPSQQAFCRRCSAWRGSLGLEPTPEMYVEHLVEIFREVKRVLRGDGTLWLNLGDSYASSGTSGHQRLDELGVRCGSGGGHKHSSEPTGRAPTPPGLKPKDLCGIPWRVAFALQQDGWWLRSDIIWNKPNCMPESVTDRPTKGHEYVFLLSKSARYFYDSDAIREPSARPDLMDKTRNIMSRSDAGRTTTGYTVQEDSDYRHGIPYCNPAGRNKRTVWTIPTHAYKNAHFATFPPALVEPMVKAGTSERGACPECGKGWERKTEKIGEHETHGINKVADDARGRHGTSSVFYSGTVPVKETIGWRPTCDCGVDVDSGALDPNTGWGIDVRQPYEPVPCVCLDPFAGAGTVGLVADRLQRDAILIELNPEYAEMAHKRIESESPMFSSVLLQ